MKILETIEYNFEHIGIFVVARSRSSLIKSFLKYFLFVLLTTHLCGAASLYIVYNYNQVIKCMTPIMSVCFTLSMTGQFVCLKLNEDRIKELFEKFRVMANEGKVCSRIKSGFYMRSNLYKFMVA